MINTLEYLNRVLGRLLLGIAGLFLLFMMALACSNMVLRTIWAPVKGTFELMGFAGAMVTAFAMASTQQGQGHIAVTFLKGRFPPAVEKLLVAVSLIASVALFAVITWQSWRWAGTLLASGEVSETLHIIYYPFAFAVALGFGALSLSLITDLCLLLCRPGAHHR